MDTIVRITYWYKFPAADLASALSALATITPMSLVQFFGAVVAAGGDAEKLGELWDVAGGRWIDRAEIALQDGDLSAVNGLLATIPASVKASVGATTMTAVQTVVTGATLNAGGTQEAFTAEGVAAALTAAGYVWDENWSTWQYAVGEG